MQYCKEGMEKMVLSKKFAKLPLKFEPYTSQMVRSKI